MRNDRPSNRGWRDLELFRSARAFAQGGCALPAVIVFAGATALLISI
jgi:hypothetical protein